MGEKKFLIQFCQAEMESELLKNSNSYNSRPARPDKYQKEVRRKRERSAVSTVLSEQQQQNNSRGNAPPPFQGANFHIGRTDVGQAEGQGHKIPKYTTEFRFLYGYYMY